MMKSVFLLLGFALPISGCMNTDNSDWHYYGGNKAGNRYSSLQDINIQNVENLAHCLDL